MGWTVDTLRREYVLLREELAGTLRRRARAIAPSAIEEGFIILNRILEQAEDSSVRGLLRARTTDDAKPMVVPSSQSEVARDHGVSSHG